ncbi:MAG: hypothetical protein ABI880_08375 [Acidobacteriota bacterium]
MANLLTVDERRRSARRSPEHLGFAAPAILRPGMAVAVVELSSAGALVESTTPVRPGATTELGLDDVSGRRHAVRVSVVRCWVTTLDPLRYRCAVRFERLFAPG